MGQIITKGKFSFVVLEDRGSRAYMEDAHSIFHSRIRGCNFLRITLCDGHGGNRVSKYIARTLPKHLRQLLTTTNNSINNALRRAFAKTQAEMNWAIGVGATVICCVITDQGKLWIANTGDAQAVIISNSGEISLVTASHRVKNPNEVERIQREGNGIIKGPYLYRVVAGETQEGLMPTRVLGDNDFNGSGISHKPEIISYQLHDNDKWLMVACDGLWDALDKQLAARIYSSAASVDHLSDLLYQVYSDDGKRDNLTLIVVELPNIK